MVTSGIDFSCVNQMGSYLLTCRSSIVVIMSRSLMAISGTRLVLCVDKRSLYPAIQ